MLILAAGLLTGASPGVAAKLSPPSPQMPAGEFLARAEPLLKRSMATLVFSGEARALARALGTSAAGHRERLDRDKAAGRPTSACPPPKGKASLAAGEFLGFLRRLSPAEKARSLDHAVGGYMSWKYPCSGKAKVA